MSAGEYCTREVVVVERSESVRSAVELMRAHHVGNVIVVERTSSGSRPKGILTDRDIVIELLAKDIDPATVSVGDVMSDDLQTVHENTKLLDVTKVMRTKGIRRLPVVSTQGNLVGILAVDDILALILEQLSDLVGLIVKEQLQESTRRN
jgi:CBS domain-containing protein